MANFFPLSSKIVKTTIFVVLLAISFGYGNSARILDEATDITDTVDPTIAPAVTPDATLPSGQVPGAGVNAPVPIAAPIAGPLTPLPADAAPVVAPDDGTAGGVVDDPSTTTAPATNVPSVTTPATTSPGGGAAAAATTPGATAATAGTAPGAVAANANPDHPELSFFMHDILGGSRPSGRVVTGIVVNTNANGLPFSKPNNQVFPINGGVPLNTINGVITNNNYPFLVGLNGSPSNTIVSNNNNNVISGNNNQPFVTAGQLPAGLTLQQLMFGSVTVVDNEITEGHELGTAVIGRAQGLYLASSLDGSSHTLALTVLFHGSDHEVDDTISFFGVHRTATPISHLAIIGGTGKYDNAKGYATIETDLHHEDQHTTDGVETITHFTVYITP